MTNIKIDKRIENKPNYFSVIPATVRYDNRLCPHAVLLFSEITALCNVEGFCWATNNYFATLYKVEKKSVSRWIKQLVDYGYIKSVVEYNKDTKQIIRRKLFLNINPFSVEENITPMDKNVHTPMDKNVHTPMDKNVPDNNTSIINTSINNIYSSSVKKPIEGVNDNSSIKSKKSPSTKQLTDEFETIWNIYPNKKGKVKALELYIKARKNKTTFDEVFSGVKKYNEEIRIKRTEPQFVKHGDTWFRNRNWEDEYITNDILINDSYNINSYEQTMDVFDAQVKKEEERRKAKAEARAKVIELAKKEHEENVRKYDEKYAQELEESEDLEEYESTKEYFNHLLAKGCLLDGTRPPEPKTPEYDLFENIENEEEYFAPPQTPITASRTHESVLTR